MKNIGFQKSRTFRQSSAQAFRAWPLSVATLATIAVVGLNGCGIREYVPFLPESKYVDYGGGHKLTKGEAAYLQRIRDLHAALRVNPNDPVAWLSMGDLLRRKGDYRGAKDCYLNARQRDETLAAAHYGLGVLALYEERWSEASAHFAHARKYNPDDARIRRAVGAVLLGQDEPRKALTAFDEALQLDPEYTPAYLDKARTLYRLQNYQEAELVCRAALKNIPQPAEQVRQKEIGLLDSLIPDSWLSVFGATDEYDAYELVKPEMARAEAAFDLALCLKAQGRLREALAALAPLEATGAPSAAHTDAQLLKSRLQASLGDYPGAAATLKQLRVNRPELAEIPKRLAKIYERQDLHKEAAGARLTAAELDQTDRILQEEAVQAARSEKRLDWVITGYERLTRIVPDDPRYHRALAESCEEAGLSLRATGAWRDYLRLRPNDWDAVRKLGFLYADTPGSHGRAILQFKQLLDRQPEDTEARLRMAELLLQSNNLADAEKHVREVVRLKPDEPKARQYLGVFLGQAKRFDAAVEEFKKALSLDPKLAVAHLNLAKVYRSQYRLEESAESLRTYLALNKEDDDARMLLAQTLRDLNDREGAVKIYAELAERRPDDVPVRIYLAELQAHLGNNNEAFGLLEETLEKYPANAEVLRSAARLYSKAERPLRELYCRRRLLKLEPNDVESLERAAELCDRLGDHAAALEYWRTLGKTGRGAAWRQIARIHRRYGRPAAALDACRMAVKTDEKDAASHSLLAELLREAASDPKITDNRKQALRREALSHYDAMILLSPKDYDARVNRASLLCETNDLSGAQVCFEDLLREFKTQERPSTELRSAAAASHVGLGVIYRKRGRFEQAQKEYERALELSPNSALTHLNLGLLYDFHLKKPEEARTHYQRYLDAGGDYEALPEDSPARPPPPKSADAKHSAAEKR